MRVWVAVDAFSQKLKVALKILVVVSCLVMFISFTPLRGAQKIERHETASRINLVPGANRGTITLPLLTGTIASTGQKVLFVISDASDKDFATRFGSILSESLALSPDESVEDAIFLDGKWTFLNDPGLVSRFDKNGNVLPPISNSKYSPLKRINWNGKMVILNLPFIKWGNKEGQKLLIDKGECDPLIRSNPPSPLFVWNGPTSSVDCSNEGPLDRYKGGQVIDLDLKAMTVTMKLHKATFRHPNVVPYYIVFEASKGPPAGFMGVIHAPKLAKMGRAGSNESIGRIVQFANGVRINSGGPNRFQPGLASYTGGQQNYTPMWHITFIFFDCDNDGVFFKPKKNIGEGAIPKKGSKIPLFDPDDPATFDPFGMDDKGVSCKEFTIKATGNADGFIVDLSHLDDLINDKFAIQTEAPAGLRLNSPMQPPLIVNCPVPLTVSR